MSLTKKPEPNLPKRLLKKCSRFQKPDFTKKSASRKNELCQTKPLACQKPNLKTLKPI
jgi:hypothetical protein